ncbi:hypothetical protein OSB04_007247 [Centaurea solstitialis]|uniref:non-specific serine/threonine protein kinase n=1 Tax=Centaurea solstitialis TaxID=347529 RepID=A0AA38WIA8_9ASTR|nr:hypothetical protein OSB04_007247 [Centaurea solstitialis]
MKPNLHLFPLLLILATTIRFPAIECRELQLFDACGPPVHCGNLYLDYPFWGLGRPDYCGHSGFELTCQFDPSELNDYFILRYESIDYRILETDSNRKAITIARNDLWNDVCPQYLRNTSCNSTLFGNCYIGNQNVSLYYGCHEPIKSLDNRFSCDKNGTNNYGYFKTKQPPECESHVIVPVKAYNTEILPTSNATERDLTRLLRVGFDLRWKANNDECDQCISSGGWCGSNRTRPELFACYCYTGNFSLTCNNMDVNASNSDVTEAQQPLDTLRTLFNQADCHKTFTKKNRNVTILRCILSNHPLNISCRPFMQHCRNYVHKLRDILLWRTQKAANDQLEMFIRNYGTQAPKRYKYSEIKKMTNSFQEELGRGGYGIVYKGLLPDGQLVAVKVLASSLGDGEDFINEVASISRTSHINIVTLLGFCIEGKRRALIYEFMPNGSLDKFLRGDDSRLDWNTLFLIAKGIARGLEYLHRGCNTRIVHFDIKPHNILLDTDFVPKISDFGLAKLCKWKESIVSVMGARGTAGYMAPEVFLKSLGGASHKSDVYSYGMMVLEMTGAREKNNSCPTSASEAYFPEWIYKKVEAGENLGVYGVTNEDEDEMARKMVMVSLWCIQSGPSDRPSISKVMEMLEGSLESLQVPPSRFWPSPTRPAQDTSSLAAKSSTNKTLSTVQSAGEESSS